MTIILANAEPVFLLSIAKPIIFLVVVGLWAFVVSRFDKDLKANFLPRELWNGIQVGAGALAFLLWLVIPFFALGMFVALLVVVGAMIGYALFRNQHVPEPLRWRLSMDMFTSAMESRGQAAAQKEATIQLARAGGPPLPVPQAEEPAFAAHEAMEMMMEFALARHAERFDLLAEGQHTAVSVQIDGIKYPQPNLDAALGLNLIDYLKQSAGLDAADRRRRQSGKISFVDGENNRHTFKLSTMGSTRGLVLTAQADRGGQPIAFDKLGLVGSQKTQLLAALATPGRVVIVAAAPHQGQSTTLYALTARHDPYTQSVIALEEDFEFDLEGVTHEKLDPGMDAAAVNQKLKAAMLREAQVVLMTKLADNQTAAMMAEYAATARFYVGLRFEDTFAALRGWAKLLGDTKTAAAALNAIVAQRLVRRLCKTCRVPYKPDPEVLRKLNLPPGKVSNFYKHSGQLMVKDQAETCPDCLGLGYRGQVGVFEVMALDDEARELLAAGQVEPLRAHLRKQKMLWLQEAALMKVIEGETSIAEITRAMSGPEKASAKA